MSKWIVGSARIDENGHAHGGAAGDQKQTAGTPDYKGEVSMQTFYVHSKGWYIFRAKKEKQRKKLAKCMIRACNNKNIGYDQWQRDGVVVKGTATKTPTECDCSSLVRRCIIEACGKDPGNIRTVTMPAMLKATGLFEPMMSYTSNTTLYTGDILVTKVSGHTVIVCYGEDANDGKVAQPTLCKGDEGEEVLKLQKNLNSLGYKDDDRKVLEEDGDFGPRTEQSLIRFQRSAKTLEPDGIYGPKTYTVMKNAIG